MRLQGRRLQNWRLLIIYYVACGGDGGSDRIVGCVNGVDDRGCGDGGCGDDNYVFAEMRMVL